MAKRMRMFLSIVQFVKIEHYFIIVASITIKISTVLKIVSVHLVLQTNEDVSPLNSKVHPP